MKWDAVLAAVGATCAADPFLAAIYGSAIRLTGSGAHRVPVLEFMLIADSETELWAPCTVQLDQFTQTLTAQIASERRLRQLFHLETPRDIGGMPMWAQYQDGETLAEPDRDGYFGRAIRFRLTPLRERYEGSPIS